MRGIIYCRVSSHDQVQGTSLENQRIACEQYATSHGIDVEQIFIEKGESATAANRTELVRAMNYCRDEKDIGAFIVWKVDRFARNTTDHFGVKATLFKYGTTLHSVTEPITDDPQGKLMETMLAGFAQFENDIRKQRCIGGMQGSLRKGLNIGHPKFGYKRDKKKGRRITEPDKLDESKSYLLRKGMLLYSEGNTSVSELERLSKEWGLYAPNGRPLYKQRWSELLEDKYYAGVLTDPWTGEEYQGLHEPLISLDIYEKIQVAKYPYKNKTAKRQLHNPEFPLRGFVKCSVCGNALTGSKSKGRKQYHSYYHCRTKDCPVHGLSIRKNDLENTFVDELAKLTPKEEYLKLFEANVLKVWQEKRLEVSAIRQGYDEQLKAFEARLNSINEMRADGDIDKETHRRMKSDVENKIAGLKTSHKEAEIQELDLEARIEYSIQNIRNMSRIWPDLQLDQQIRLQSAVLPNGITYNKESGSFGTAPLSYSIRLLSDFPKDVSSLVAGPGIEPGSGGYEPPEVPLLYPAM